MNAYIYLKNGTRLCAEFSDVVSKEFHIAETTAAIGSRDGAIRVTNALLGGGTLVIRSDEIQYMEVMP